MRASPSVRVLRAAVFAALCVLLAAGGHALATGAAPPVWAQAAGFAPVFGAGYLLGGRERSLAAIGAGTLTAQGGLHLTFDAARAHGLGSLRSMTSMQGMSGMHGTASAHGMRMAAHAQVHNHTHALTPHATAAHVTAAVLLTWWLRRGEAALWSLLRRAATLVPGLAAWWQVRDGARGVPAAPDAVALCAVRPRPLGRRLLLRHAVQRRGPPLGTSYAI
ncbi:hypothetical protein [Streptomyces pseudovenezuelae]|uniref:PE-PGRS family protein n=1 Tax=Streptomyces pseudovenezuelae TaxID=67350 RepID=A0ABT6LS95_9ACTN|nr:hypothetical protein [Streptomyces pseudovenezuelae]MDH6218785.1 hypothetical protein [Streptomyces pseudovenezuelae]